MPKALWTIKKTITKKPARDLTKRSFCVFMENFILRSKYFKILEAILEPQNFIFINICKQIRYAI